MEDQVGRQSEAWRISELEQLQLQTLQAGEAQSLLSNPVLVAWFRDSESSAFNVLDALPLSDSTARERLTLMIVLIRKLKTALEEYVANGKFAADRLNELLELGVR